MMKLKFVFLLTVLMFNVKVLIGQQQLGILETDHELRYIGMPVGGICTGQVYLGGDGQLWYWDIFNIAKISSGNEGGHRYYLNPLVQENNFENGFGITINSEGFEYKRLLNKSGFSDITFQGEYPIGKVTYRDPQLPIKVELNAYTPFIPTDADNSGLPVVVMEYTVTNESKTEMDVALSGWLQNTAAYWSGQNQALKGQHQNRIVNNGKYTRLVCENIDRESDQYPDAGNMSLTLIGEGVGDAGSTKDKGALMYEVLKENTDATSAIGEKLVGSVSSKVLLKPGEQKTFTFHLSWYFPNVHLWDGGHHWNNKEDLRHYYSSQFEDAAAVSDYLMEKPELIENTKIWNKTWYNSSLPKWFLDRTFVNVSTLATTASVRFNDLKDRKESEGRFYTYEGVYLGEGTCTHVFHYEQALGRVFPDLAQHLREQVDLGLSFQDNGIISYRGEFSGLGRHDGRGFAIDGHAGTVMRIYREHLMSSDSEFLKRNWKKIKKSIQVMINQDMEKTGKADGIIEGPQYNTLDRTWYGKISWISGLYAASLKAGKQMALEMGDKSFAKTCDKIANRSFKNISRELFNGEYFVQINDPDHPEAPNTNEGCHIDQLLGQYWSSQLDLGYIVDPEKAKKALTSIVKYNFVDQYGDYLKNADIPVKRYYADKDESGVIMATFPRGGTDIAPGVIANEWEKLVIGYFSEIWTGQEHQLAATLISEGLVSEGLKIEKAIHDRYTSQRRNPYNEIEYGNHYTRAMSGYAPFIAASGFTYHGPKGIIGFAPKLSPENYRSAFITAEGWGSFSQNISDSSQKVVLTLNYGKLNLNEIKLELPKGKKASKLRFYINGKEIKTLEFKLEETKLNIRIHPITLSQGDVLKTVVTLK
ncbi:GH116 family glycosyl-hydrolase [Arenibacter sp. S6351L]|uniref:GH116 family glycosyl-hydrolase n=1 Tax=Arenibacter sp. S6351L TaxID=2926407 RepID=UPI001FF2FBE9|nr:GH116 family glycosyl-hydrolase [Arenibacter sp. S6351L]MCK0136020.1 non-lysosomal glucosylceramidase [Arenibacter sp. S6351L]